MGIVPVVYLWFPYQVVKDVLVALRPAGSRPLLRLWWSSWLVYLVTDHATWFLLPGSGAADELAARAVGPIEALNASACLVALVGWVLVVRTLWADQEKAATDAVRDSAQMVGEPAGPAAQVEAPVFEPGGFYLDPPAGMSPPSPQGRPGSRAMAVWAFVLAVIPIPLTWLAAIALALTSLVQSRRGKGYAVAALVIAPLWILLSIGTLAVVFLDQATSGPADPQARPPDSPSSPPSPTDAAQEPDPSSGQKVFVEELRVGDCLPKGYPMGQPESVRVAPCGQPHLEEVYARFNLAAGPYPGAKHVNRQADRGCFQRFKPFVGISFDSSELDMYYLTPVRDYWRENRAVLCTVAVSSPTTGTLEGSRR